MSTHLTFEAALAVRTQDMMDAYTRCGKCVEICPMTGPAGVDAAPADVIGGVFDIVRTGDGPAASTAWAQGCSLTGDCIEACPEGINPRFLLAMARAAFARHTVDARERRKRGIDHFRAIAEASPCSRACS
jgi:Fe-S oxidoreductase